ncbi:SLBB domain-containing protein [Phenylobacterium koreense]
MATSTRAFAAWLIMMALAPSVAAAQLATPAPPVVPLAGTAPQVQNSPDTEGEYVLGPEDVLEIEIVGQAEKARARVYTDGTVQLNLVGKIEVAGKTPRELGTIIASELKKGGFYANPVVNVEVANYASRYVTVLGAVASPGLVPINRRYRLSEILARVGGVQESGADYVIVRPENGPEQRYLIEKLATGDSNDDPYVTPGDKIFSPAAEVFYISGQVNSPGTYAVKQGLTIAQAIARGGGLTQSGSDRKVSVTREGKKIKLDSSAAVEPGDVVVVGERLF